MLNQYPREVLETWSTKDLGKLYMRSFGAEIDITMTKKQTDTVSEILSRREFREVSEIYNMISLCISESTETKEYYEEEIFTRMKDHFLFRIIFGFSAEDITSY